MLREEGCARRQALCRVTHQLYDSYMSEIAVSDARENLAEVIENASKTSEPMYLTRRGRTVAVILNPDTYEQLVTAAEDAVDRAELAASRERADYVPWEQVKADLGL